MSLIALCQLFEWPLSVRHAGGPVQRPGALALGDSRATPSPNQASFRDIHKDLLWQRNPPHACPNAQPHLYPVHIFPYYSLLPSVTHLPRNSSPHSLEGTRRLCALRSPDMNASKKFIGAVKDDWVMYR